MSNNNIENKTQIVKYTSCIQILGKYSQSISSQEYPYPYIQLNTSGSVYCPQLQTKLDPHIPQAKKIFVEGNLIAIIDYYDNLWLISELFPSQINVSAMLLRKIKNVYLGEGQCIFSSKKSPILLNWGAKKIIDVSNFQTLKLNQKYFKNASGFFTAYQISNAHKDDRYFYSNIKKIDNSNKLYQARIQFKEDEIIKKESSMTKRNKISKINKEKLQIQENYSILAYPTYQNSFMRSKVIGISVGKVHCMCWDITGALYTWGNRTIALGYPQLPHQKITIKPKKVQGLNKFITMGFAATHYSLALSSQGNLYQWGIKKTVNTMNQQLIFQPRVLPVGFNEYKIIMIKGKLDIFACLNSKHELFLWGEKSAKLLPFQVQEQKKFKNGFIYQPFLVPYLKNQNIVDFGIGDQFIAILISNSGTIVSQQQRIYWNDMIKRVKTKLKIGCNLKTQALKETNLNIQTKCQEQQINPTYYVNMNSQPTQSKVQKAYEQRNLKKQYFRSLKNQDKMFINLLKKNKENNLVNQQINQMRNQSKLRFYSERNDLNQKMALRASFNKQNKQNYGKIFIPSLQKKYVDFLQTSQLAAISAKKFIQENLSQTLKQVMLKKIPRQTESKRSKLGDFNHLKLKTESYQARLQRVQMRKKSLQQSYIEEVSKKIKQNSIEYRTKRHQQIIDNKNHEKHRNLLKNTLYTFLVKNYIVKLITSPIQEARKVKIQQFGKGLHLSRIQKNLRLIFIKTRVKHGLKKLQKLNFLTYALLCTVFKRFVKKRREQKNKLMRKIVAQQIYKNVLKQKIRFGISRTHLNTRKIQKFSQWLKMIKIQRIKCLKVLWKNYLLATMKVTNDSDAIIICKPQQNCTFQELYKQKIINNPMLNLQTFLNKCPIFQIRFQYFQSIIYLFRKDNKIKSQKILKNMKGGRRKQKIKFNGESELVAVTNGIQGSPDLLPYSLHYNLLIRPKSMQLNIPQGMKKNQRWVFQQRAIFQKFLNQIIEIHEKNFLKAKRQYDIDLAYFIRQKYDTLAQKRWKSIIEYNQIKITSYKKKKQKQLYRIFGLIGMQRILNQDFLPEKYLMLQEAVKKRDAPPPPNSYINFDINTFKEFFKKYYQTVSLKAKQFRRKNNM